MGQLEESSSKTKSEWGEPGFGEDSSAADSRERNPQGLHCVSSRIIVNIHSYSLRWVSTAVINTMAKGKLGWLFH